MERYKFLKQKTFEKVENFEKRLNEEVGRGWRVNSFSSDSGSLAVLLEKER